MRHMKFSPTQRSARSTISSVMRPLTRTPGFGGAGGAGFGGFGGFGDLGDIFGDMFSGFGFGGGSTRSNPNAPRRGESIETSVTVSFEEAAFGCKKEVTVPRIEQCPDCKGTAARPVPRRRYAPTARAAAQSRPRSAHRSARCSPWVRARSARGTGKIIHQPCKTCRGMGKIRRQHKLTVNIPAGIDDGQAFSVSGAGNAGSNGGPAGDLIVTVLIRQHERFERDGTSVLLEQDINFAQATLGAEIEVPTLDGRVKLTIPEGTQSGTTFRIRGKGIPYVRGNGRGDQFVTVNIRTPKNLTSSQKELLRQVRRVNG